MTLAIIARLAAAPRRTFMYQVTREKTGWFAALLSALLFGTCVTAIGQIVDGQALTAEYQWVPSLDLNLALRLDGLSLLFALIITGIGTLVFIYSAGYLGAHQYLGRYYAQMMLFMASMLGLVTADNILLLFIFWELTSFTSYLLIAFHHEKESAREAARQALIVTSAGGLVMFAGLILLALTARTWDISEMLPAGQAIRAHALYLPILLLIAVGAFTKSAQFPFHFWLPAAMEAPTPVSAYLHSATMVNAGIYLLARLFPILGHTDEWQFLITSAGAVTLLMGGYLAWQKTDLKLILAYSTVSALGMMVLLLGLGTEETVAAALVFMLVHALYKGALFMIAGAVDHHTGTREITQLGGLRHTMPYAALAALVAALSMAGIPPALGFIAKELTYEAGLHLNAQAVFIGLITLISLLGNVFNVAAAGLVAVRPFWGAEKHIHSPHSLPISLWLGALVLGGLGLLLGLFPASLCQSVMDRAAAALTGEHAASEMALWHGFSTPLLLSLFTLAGGVALYFNVDRLRPSAARPDPITRILAPGHLYQRGINSVLNGAVLYSDFVLKAHLRQYIRIILITFVVAMGFMLTTELELGDLTHRPGIRVYELAIAGVIVAAAITSTQLNKRLSASAALGAVGYGVTLLYVLYGAPDLAMTQFAVETLTVILFVVVIYRLPKLRSLSSARSRRMDAVLAVAVGATMTLLTLVVTSVPLQSRLSPFFAEKSLTAAHGRNVVNVILVDFRGFDTMGEITVLSVAAIGVLALLRLVPGGQSPRDEEGTN